MPDLQYNTSPLALTNALRLPYPILMVLRDDNLPTSGLVFFLHEYLKETMILHHLSHNRQQ